MANIIHGLHLLVDGRVEDPNVFTENHINSLIVELARALDMQIILGPIAKQVELDPSKLTGDIFVDEGGVSSICMISTSHISIHVWPLRRVFLMDIFSCRDFDARRALEIVRNYFAPIDMTTRQVYRSPESPSNLEASNSM